MSELTSGHIDIIIFNLIKFCLQFCVNIDSFFFELLIQSKLFTIRAIIITTWIEFSFKIEKRKVFKFKI